MKRDLVTSAIGILVFTLLLGIVYPLLVTGVGQVAFPGNANGQQVHSGGRLIGSKIIGQSFATPVLEKGGKPKEVKGVIVTEPDPRYFQTRPSATEGGADNAAASAFSNKGPNSVKTKEADEENIKAYLELNKKYDPSLNAATVPVDAVNTSASGVDPEISKANALIQAYRIAALRGLPLASVDRLIARYTNSKWLGFSGEDGVDVLELNLA